MDVIILSSEHLDYTCAWAITSDKFIDRDLESMIEYIDVEHVTLSCYTPDFQGPIETKEEHPIEDALREIHSRLVADSCETFFKLDADGDVYYFERVEVEE